MRARLVCALTAALLARCGAALPSCPRGLRSSFTAESDVWRDVARDFEVPLPDGLNLTAAGAVFNASSVKLGAVELMEAGVAVVARFMPLGEGRRLGALLQLVSIDHDTLLSVGYDQAFNSLTVHVAGDEGGGSAYETLQEPASGFVTFAVRLWDGRVEFYVEGQLTHVSAGVRFPAGVAAAFAGGGVGDTLPSAAVITDLQVYDGLVPADALRDITGGVEEPRCDAVDGDVATAAAAECPSPSHRWACGSTEDTGTEATPDSQLNATLVGALMSGHVPISTPFTLELDLTALDDGYGRVFAYNGITLDQDGATGFMMAMWMGGSAMLRSLKRGVLGLSAEPGGALHFSVDGAPVTTVYRRPWSGFNITHNGPLLGVGPGTRNMTCTSVKIYPTAGPDVLRNCADA